MEKGISILMCTQNGRNRIFRSLKSISEQKVDKNLNWEVILVDNNSKDNTKEYAVKVWKKFNTSVPFHTFFESRPGKENAVDKGFRMSSYSYVVICDDDNWLEVDYIQNAFDIMTNNSSIGVLGGKGIPIFEETPPNWFSRYAKYYAVGSQNDKNGEIIPDINIKFIWGAGAVVNRTAYNLLIDSGFTRAITKECLPKISRNEDLELVLAIQLAGYKLWYSDKLVYKHFISKEKVRWEYLISLSKQGAMARPYLMVYNALRVINIDSSKSAQFKTYKKYWKQHKYHWIRLMIKSNLSLAGVRCALHIFLQNHLEGDHSYFHKLVLWYEFASILRFRSKEFKDLYFKLFKLKAKISPDYW